MALPQELARLAPPELALMVLEMLVPELYFLLDPVPPVLKVVLLLVVMSQLVEPELRR